jgi:hypothetical protein
MHLSARHRRSTSAGIRLGGLLMVIAVVAAFAVANASDAGTTTIRVNAGGKAVGDWAADSRSAGSPFLNLASSDLHTAMTTSDIKRSSARDAGSVPVEMFQDVRIVRPGAEPMRWTLPARNGGVGELKLYFAEFRDRFTEPGTAVFDVAVNGTVVLSNVDVIAEVGTYAALVKSVPVIANGDVTVEIRPTVGRAAIAGLELELERGGSGTTRPTPPTTEPAPPITKPTKPTAPPPTTPPVTTPPTTRPPGDGGGSVGGKLAFAPPALDAPTTIEVSAANRALKLAPDRDYIIDMPDGPLVAAGGLSISGGRNVVLIGGHIHHDRWWSDEPGKSNRGLMLQGQTGTIHIEGLLVSGNIGEGINLSQTQGAIVQLQNIRIESATGTQSSNHADLIQTWAGPRRLLIDRFTGYTSYQGFFLLPNQWYSGPAPERFELRNVNLVGDPAGAGYLFWVDSNRTRFPVVTHNLWAQSSASKAGDRNQFLWPQPKTGDGTWNLVQEGRPAGGDIVTRASAGANYRSPGYS